MRIDRHISTTQIVWVTGVLFGIALAVAIGSAIGNQDFQLVALVLGAFATLGAFLALGKNYWLLIPLSLGARFPAVPLGGRSLEFPELCIAGCCLFFVLRIATRKEKFQIFRSVNIPFLIFIAWVGMIFALNPIGFAMLGSSVGGGRFYLKLGLAFAAFFILSNRDYSEKDVRWVISLLIFGACFSTVYGIAEYFLAGPPINPATGMVEEEFYTWHQVLSVPALTIAFLIFARWSPKDAFSFQRPGIVFAYVLCIILVLLSGKRMGLLAVLLAPLVSALVYRQYVYFPAAFAAVFLGVALLVAGQGQWFSLPLVAQRALSWLPGDWDPEMERFRGGTDEWRAELRRFALENIKRDPWMGRGFAVDLQDTLTAIGMREFDGSLQAQTAAFALGRSWHNTWLGYAADFGIPFSFMQAAVWTWVMILCYRGFRELGPKSLRGVFCLYVFIYTSRDFVASWTSGHSALDAFDRWWMYGIVVAIYLQCKISKNESFHRKFAGSPAQPAALQASRLTAAD